LLNKKQKVVIAGFGKNIKTTVGQKNSRFNAEFDKGGKWISPYEAQL
jgi:hypothetical protein